MCASGAAAMSAHEEEEEGDGREESDCEESAMEEEEEEGMRDSSQLAPTQFHVSVTTCSSACEEKEVERGKCHSLLCP